MNRKRIDDLIPIALKEIKETYVSERTMLVRDGKIENKYSGYIASMGPIIRQTSLGQTFLFYQRKSEKADRGVITHLIGKMLQENLLAEDFEKREMGDRGDAKDYSWALYKATDRIRESQNITELYLWRNRVFEAIVALKLAIRCWDSPKEDKNNE